MEPSDPQPLDTVFPAAGDAELPPDFKPEFLTFLLDGVPFAIPVDSVREVVGCLPITDVPGASPVLRGVMNVRGAVVPVLDLRVALGLPPAPITRRSCVVIHELLDAGREVPVGALVDVVQAVLGADHEDASSAGPGRASNIGAVRKEFVVRELMLGGRPTILLNTERLLALDELKERLLQ